ncbi:MAG: hypothetical protein FJ087_19435 [Deltaproteobacteria bacterium]|nr:hypothetical protein [Deltaproteobacteria bacterium]
MPSVSQRTGMQGVFLVAAELSRKGFVVSPTPRSAIGADLLVTDASCCRAFSVQHRFEALLGEHASHGADREVHAILGKQLRDLPCW